MLAVLWRSAASTVSTATRAVDLARLSLWLATLARDHEFTFLDHALKCGDSLVGLTPAQIAAANWDESKPGLPLFRQLVRDRVAKATKGRSEIQNAPDDTMRAVQEARHRSLEVELAPIRTMGDAVISAFFAADKAKAREKKRAEVESWLSGSSEERWDKLEAAASSLRTGDRPIPPFHWQIEFPEVFARENGGFDAIVGNPPFAGKNMIIHAHRKGYIEWLQSLHPGTHGASDLVAHFFRRAFDLTRKAGVFGLIATNSIAQGDTRQSGLQPILLAGGAILRARRRLQWPGEAAVVVSVVHIIRGTAESPVLDGKKARRISAFLVDGNVDLAPAPLKANAGKSYKGAVVLGMGFTFDDVAAAKGTSSSLADMERLLEQNPTNGDVIFPYIGGEELNNDPKQRHRRFVIDFGDLSEVEARKWPALLEIIERKVKPDRLKQGSIVSPDRWWMHARSAADLYARAATLDRVIAISEITPHLAFAFLPTGVVYAHTLKIITLRAFSEFGVLQSRIHEIWVRFLGSTFEDRLIYAPTDVFRNFPFPLEPALREVELPGEEYHLHRAQLMIDRDEGLTKTYNRFHARGENGPDIARLRVLHADMDRAVLRAYGWDDLADRAAPEFIEQDADEGKKPKTRLDWPAAFKDEVLARLLALNAERGAAERAAGLTAADEDDEDEIDQEVDA
jgi:hypothetical protein